MKPEKAAEAPRNAGRDPSTMKMKQWYQGHDRVSDQKAPTGTDRASYHARERIEDDDERLAMRQGDMPPPEPERVANPRIRETEQYRTSDRTPEKMHRATSEKRLHKSMLFDYLPKVFPSPDIQIFITCQRISAASSSTTWVPSTERVNFGKLRILISRFLQMKSSTLPTILSCHFSQNSGETTNQHM